MSDAAIPPNIVLLPATIVVLGHKPLAAVTAVASRPAFSV